jgi:general stress protein 26
MAGNEPAAELNPKFSSPDATATEWADAREQVAGAEIFWLSTVREDGRPHVTPLISVLLEGAFYFCASADERKAKNLESNPNVVLTTGSNSLAKGLDIVIEGTATRVSDAEVLRRVADAYVAKYGLDWEFTPRDGLFHHDDGDPALVYAIAPVTGFGFARGGFSQTRWRF